MKIRINLRLFQNFSFWNSNLRFKGKSGHLAAFSKRLFQNQPGFGTTSSVKKNLTAPVSRSLWDFVDFLHKYAKNPD
jgi:hypothetical protein